jgi:hypothetical protein
MGEISEPVRVDSYTMVRELACVPLTDSNINSSMGLQREKCLQGRANYGKLRPATAIAAVAGA